jgi:hypothetical protein
MGLINNKIISGLLKIKFNILFNYIKLLNGLEVSCLKFFTSLGYLACSLPSLVTLEYFQVSVPVLSGPL